MFRFFERCNIHKFLQLTLFNFFFNQDYISFNLKLFCFITKMLQKRSFMQKNGLLIMKKKYLNCNSKLNSVLKFIFTTSFQHNFVYLSTTKQYLILMVVVFDFKTFFIYKFSVALFLIVFVKPQNFYSQFIHTHYIF